MFQVQRHRQYKGPFSHIIHQRHTNITVHSSTVYVTHQDGKWLRRKKGCWMQSFEVKKWWKDYREKKGNTTVDEMLLVCNSWRDSDQAGLTHFHPYRPVQPEIIISNRPVFLATVSFISTLHLITNISSPVLHGKQTEDAVALQIKQKSTAHCQWFKTRKGHFQF